MDDPVAGRSSTSLPEVFEFFMPILSCGRIKTSAVAEYFSGIRYVIPVAKMVDDRVNAQIITLCNLRDLRKLSMVILSEVCELCCQMFTCKSVNVFF
jgi:hypothetical protein